MPGNRTLTPCPDSPNCVSSLAADVDHRVNPLRYGGSLSEAREQVLSVLRSMERMKLVAEESHYIHAEFSSALFRFVDDVELYFPVDAKVIHVRSASRTGYYDFGVNRSRIERIRTLMAGKTEAQ